MTVNLQEGIKLLRTETGITQMDLSKELEIGFATLNRWENGKSRPNHRGSRKLMEFAREHQVSSACLEYLSDSLFSTRAKTQEEHRKVTETAEKMKYEDRERLTSEQLKMTVDHLPMGVVAARIYKGEEPECDIFYFNQFLGKMLGYTKQEVSAIFKEDIYAFISKEDMDTYRRAMHQVVTQEIPFEQYLQELRVYKKNGRMAWVCVRVLSLKEFTYGTELFITYEDITTRVEAQNKYQEDLRYRREMLKKELGWVYCDITENRIIFLEGQQSVGYVTQDPKNMEELCGIIAKHIPIEAERKKIVTMFQCSAMRENYAKGNTSGETAYYDVVHQRWIGIKYEIIVNPDNGNLEAFISIKDRQKDMMSKTVMDILTNRFFDYIGFVDVKSGKVDCFQQANQEIIVPKQIDAGRVLEVQKQLEEKEFYSIFLSIEDKQGRIRKKKIMYHYMSPAHHMLIIAMSDVERLAVLGEKAVKEQ